MPINRKTKIRICAFGLLLSLLSAGCSLLASPPAASPILLETPLASITASSPGADFPLWQPPTAATWQWQLAGEEIDTSFDVDVYDLDAFDTSAEIVASLHLQGRRVVCRVCS